MTATDPSTPDNHVLPYRRILIVHGFGATPEDHWFPWLADTMGADRIALPHAQAPRAADWIPLVANAIGSLTPDTAVVAHSLGCISTVQAVRRLASAGGQLGCLVAVAPFAETLPAIGDPDLDSFIADGLDDFIDIDIELDASPSLRRVEVIRSDNDAIVPIAISERFAHALGAAVHVLPGAGHFLAGEGVATLESVRDLLTGG